MVLSVLVMAALIPGQSNSDGGLFPMSTAASSGRPGTAASLFTSTSYLRMQPEEPEAGAPPEVVQIPAPFFAGGPSAAVVAPPRVPIIPLPDRWWLMREVQGT